MKLHQFDSDWFQCFFWPVWPMTIQISIRIEAVIFSLAMIKSIWTSYEGWHFWLFSIIFAISCYFSVIFYYLLSFLVNFYHFLSFPIILFHVSIWSSWRPTYFSWGWQLLCQADIFQSDPVGGWHFLCCKNEADTFQSELEADNYSVRLTYLNLDWMLTVNSWRLSYHWKNKADIFQFELGADNHSVRLTYISIWTGGWQLLSEADMHFNLDWRLTIVMWGWHTFQFWLEADNYYLRLTCISILTGGWQLLSEADMHLNFDWRLTIILWGWHTFQFGLEADTFTSGQGADNHSVRLTISIWTGCNLYQSLQTVSNWLGLNHGSVWNPTIFIRLLSIPWLLWQILYKIDGNYLLHDPFGLSDYVQINEIISLDDAHEPQSPSPNSKTSISAAL